MVRGVLRAVRRRTALFERSNPQCKRALCRHTRRHTQDWGMLNTRSIEMITRPGVLPGRAVLCGPVPVVCGECAGGTSLLRRSNNASSICF